MAFLSQAPRLEGLLPSHGAFQGHAAHLMRWSMKLSPNGSRGTCIAQGLATFLHAAFTAHRSPATTTVGLSSCRQNSTFHPSRLHRLAQCLRTPHQGSGYGAEPR